LNMFARRLKFRKAKLLWPFTPVKGITPSIKAMVGASATCIESRPSELLPRRNLPDIPEGHMYYVRRCEMPRAMAIHFFTEYNAFGPSPGRSYYDEVKELCAGKDSQYVERVAYGYARDSVARAFPKFGPWNIVARKHLPQRGTNYMFTDPAGTRNWATLWVRVAPGNPPSFYIYRDWPDCQTFGEWAITTEREVSETQRRGWDGDVGPAQPGLGYGVVRYKQLFLEREQIGSDRQVDPYRAARYEFCRAAGLAPAESIALRFVDSRAAAAEHVAEKGGTCLTAEFEAEQRDKEGKVIGPSMSLEPASGVHEEEGLMAVNALLDWNMEEPLVPVLNAPHLYVCEDCQQVIWMFSNFTGLGGQKGACKDFADLVRYLALGELEYYEDDRPRGRSGKGW